MDLIKAHYEKLLVILGALLLLGAAAYIYLDASGWAERFGRPETAATGAAFAPDADLAQLKTEVEAMGKRKGWDEAPGSLFVSRIYLENEGRLVDIKDGKQELFPGIPNEWIFKHDLNYEALDLPDQDEDKDGYTNREEYMAQTDPKDAKSHPDLWSKLRLQKVDEEQLGLKFMQAQDKKSPTGERTLTEIQINTTLPNCDRVSDFYEVGEPLRIQGRDASGTVQEEPANFEIIRAYYANPNASAMEDEDPVVVIRSTTGKETIELHKGKEVNSPYPIVTFLDTRPPTREFTTRVAQKFDVIDPANPQANKTYLLVSATQENAVIKDMSTQTEYTVPRIPAEAAQVAPSPTPAPQ